MTTAPQPKKRVSRQGLELVKSFEGLRRRAARLPNGRFVVGYGHIRSTREGAEIGPDDAEALLRYDLLPIEAALNEWALAPLTQNQFDALVSFAFNIGLSAFRRSDVLRRINEGDLLRAAAGMDTWRRVDLDGEPIIVDALVRRRAVEKALFLTPPGGQVPAPSAVLKPRIDDEAFTSVLLRRPEEPDIPLDSDDAFAARPEPETEAELEGEAQDELDLVVAETTVVIPAGEDPELEPELVITETTVFVAPDGAEFAEEGDAGMLDAETFDAETFDTDAESFDVETFETDAESLDTEAQSTPAEASDLDFAPETDPDADGFDLSEPEMDEVLQDAPAEDEEQAAAAPEFSPLSALIDDQDDEEEDPEEEELSAAQAAAAAVFARLSEILAQDQDDEEDGGDLSSLTIDPEPETADGAFLQAHPSPPEDDRGTGFPEMDTAGLASFEAEAPASEVAFEPEAAQAELQPFPDDGALPPVIEPEEQAEFDSAYIDEDELDTGEPVAAPAGEHWDERSGAQPSQGDPAALSEPYEENNRAGLLIFLGLTGLAFIIGSLVSFARTPLPGADADGSGWTFVLGAVGVLCICGALWFALGPDEDEPEAPSSAE